MEEISSKIRILLVTGQEAASQLMNLHGNVINNQYHLSVHIVPTPVIALSSPEQIKRSLQETFSPAELENFSVVMLSGLIPWDISSLQPFFKAKIVKGPPFSAQIEPMLKNTPPSDLLSGNITFYNPESTAREKYKRILQRQLEKVKNTAQIPYFSLSHEFSDIIFSPQLPSVIIGEVVDFPKLSDDELIKKIGVLLEHGAQIIDLGCIPHENHSDRIKGLLPNLQKRFNIPFSIDSHQPLEIIAAVESGISFVLSITPTNLLHLRDFTPIKTVPIVCVAYSKEDIEIAHSFEIPQEYSKIWQNIADKQLNPQVSALIRMYFYLRGLEFTKILLDPLIHAPIVPGLLPSLQRYLELRQILTEMQNWFQEEKSKPLWNPTNFPQLFAGVGNVIELIDGDSSGISTLMAGITTELGISGVLLTEHSRKCFKAVQEYKRSRDLMFLAKYQNTPPINLGLNAFECRSKRIYSPIPEKILNSKNTTQVNSDISETILDSVGYFRIYVDADNDRIIAVYLPYSSPDLENSIPEAEIRLFVGNSAENLAKKIIQAKLISRLDHAAYLGRELYRAECALKMGTKYQQD